MHGLHSTELARDEYTDVTDRGRRAIAGVGKPDGFRELLIDNNGSWCSEGTPIGRKSLYDYQQQ
jgi:hypothetical protein